MESRRQRGFTLIELMAVLVVIGVLLTYAVIRIRRAQYNVSVYSYAELINTEIDSMRVRAAANGRWQRLAIDRDQVIHQEAIYRGMRTPADDEWQDVRTITSPGEIFVNAVATATHLVPADGVPADGAGLDENLDISPDGVGEAMTIFVGEESDRERARVAVFRATGASYVFDEW